MPVWMIRTGLALLAGSGILPGAAAGQSLLAREGLGIPVEALDARARGLGSSGVGLSGWSVSQADPAANAGLLLPSASASFQPASGTLTDGRDAGFTRFPALAVAYPFSGNVISLQAGSYLDQEWQAELERTFLLGDTEVTAQDVYTSRGGVSRVVLGWARRLTPGLAVGATFGTHTGTVERIFQRTIEADDIAGELGSFGLRGRFNASGLVAGAGVTWSPTEIARLGGSVHWSQELELSPTEGSDEAGRSYSMPLEVRGGGTLTLAEELSLHLSGSYADWSEIADDLEDSTTRGAAWSYGGGVEFTGVSFLNRTVPLRVGARHSDLPFEWEVQPTHERTFSLGAGMNLVEVAGEEEPRARADLGLERGSREGGSLSESFWRVTFTVRVSTG